MKKTYQFYKYQGTGNDFVMMDNRELSFDRNDLESVKKICDRKFGIGGDGLILIEPHAELDFEMVYFNSDGSQSLCGNGSRCAVMFASHLRIIGDKTTFLAIDGAHDAFIQDDLVHLKMGDVSKVDFYGEDTFIDTGSPHYIRFTEQLETCDVYGQGRSVRYNDTFKEKGTNVNFVELMEDNQIFVRTYERGVENETLSCGTGVTAASLAASLHGYQSPVKVKVMGGELSISFDKKSDDHFENIYLIGPALKVFSGQIAI